ncbi:hypothetical protein TrCOL_g1446 [Triparma columacea]|uniref:DUF7168 domain-containing protein n=1 Tax=Triparma columacea TaxID=722753 RepID=A0A9W7LCL0_9STRA|nr:hypothetical protein TrCOL_g1446 [Triparma columacea]
MEAEASGSLVDLTTSPDPPGCSLAGLVKSSQTFSPGDHVVLTGLNKSELNGVGGTVLANLGGEGRVKVKVDGDEQPKMIKPENLKREDVGTIYVQFEDGVWWEGKVVSRSKDGRNAEVDFGGNLVEVRTDRIKLRPGEGGEVRRGAKMEGRERKRKEVIELSSDDDDDAEFESESSSSSSSSESSDSEGESDFESPSEIPSRPSSKMLNKASSSKKPSKKSPLPDKASMTPEELKAYKAKLRSIRDFAKHGKVTKKKKKPKAPKAPQATYEAHMEEEDIPSAPGPALDPNSEEAAEISKRSAAAAAAASTSADSHGGLAGPELEAMKQKIAKMLTLGLHEDTPEGEARNAMKLATRYLRKFNLSQATVMKTGQDMADSENMKGGMVGVTMRHVKTHKAMKLMQWTEDLAAVVKRNFEVKLFFRRNGSRGTQVFFYGLHLNSQLAAYGFKVAFHWIHVNMKRYNPEAAQGGGRSKGADTTVARNSYAEGVVAGLAQSVREAERERAERRREKKDRWVKRLEGLKKEICRPVEEQEIKAEDVKVKMEREIDSDKDSSDDDDDAGWGVGGDDGGWGWGDSDDDDVPIVQQVKKQQERRKAYLEKKIERVERKLGRADSRASTEGALVVHQEKVAEKVLEKEKVKLKSARARVKRARVDMQAYGKGKEDSKNINLDRRAIDN